MRAKFKVTNVNKYDGVEHLEFAAIGANKYGENGENEDNDFARWTPSGNVKISVTNPNLFDTFKVNENYYLDFTKAE
jgi:hypothetical protein